ncbi:MAG TPA: hypothetical protein VN613_04885 [Gemmatimonadaceae bacterium]|nr:hypothetical protein [Gemmatimonadaceae bacterium]
MRTRLAAFVVAVCIPAAAFAQKKGGGAGLADAPDPAASAGPTAVRMPGSRDLVRMNPAALLVDKRKKLTLPDSVVKQLKAVQKTIDDRNAALMVQYDSIHKWTMPLASSSQRTAMSPGFSDADKSSAAVGPSPAEQAKMASSMRDLRRLVGDYRERRKTDVADALAVIPDAQKAAATDLLAQQDADLDKLVGGRP